MIVKPKYQNNCLNNLRDTNAHRKNLNCQMWTGFFHLFPKILKCPTSKVTFPLSTNISSSLLYSYWKYFLVNSNLIGWRLSVFSGYGLALTCPAVVFELAKHIQIFVVKNTNKKKKKEHQIENRHFHNFNNCTALVPFSFIDRRISRRTAAAAAAAYPIIWGWVGVCLVSVFIWMYKIKHLFI